MSTLLVYNEIQAAKGAPVSLTVLLIALIPHTLNIDEYSQNNHEASVLQALSNSIFEISKAYVQKFL